MINKTTTYIGCVVACTDQSVPNFIEYRIRKQSHNDVLQYPLNICKWEVHGLLTYMFEANISNFSRIKLQEQSTVKNPSLTQHNTNKKTISLDISGDI